MGSDRKVRIGLTGIGGMGSNYATRLREGEVPGAELSAVCDTDKVRLASFSETPGFTSHDEMLASGLVDAVIIATPHFLHTPLSIATIEHGTHLLVEKPLAVHTADCERIIRAYKSRQRKDLVFAVMFNQRTRPIYRKLKHLIDTGELGAIRRINWTVTDWFRPDAYYRSGGWRATWSGEGGGVLINQCPHQLDLLQWLFRMPSRVRAFGSLGKYHAIEVEDEVTAFLEYPNGATGVFVTTTGEAPGTNRLEIAADRGRVVVENGEITWTRNEVPTAEFSRTTDLPFSRPPVWNVTIPLAAQSVPEHVQVIRDFTDAISSNGTVVAHGLEGVHSVELANAMLLSMLEDAPVTLPIDGAVFEAALAKLIQGAGAPS